MGFNELVTLQLTMFSMMLVGLLLRKTNIITEEGKRCLTDLVIYIFLPCNIVKSFMVEFNLDILKSFGVVFVISIINQIFCGFESDWVSFICRPVSETFRHF